jgi:RPA family protein
MDNILKIAIKSRIIDIVKGKYIIPKSKTTLNYLETSFKQKLTKTRILGTVVTKYISNNTNKAFAIFNIDDSTETISCRLWNNLELINDIELGDIVDVMGLIREYNGDIYIVPDFIKKIEDHNLETLRRLEIIKYLKDLGYNTSTSTSKFTKTQKSEDMQKTENIQKTEKIPKSVKTSVKTEKIQTKEQVVQNPIEKKPNTKDPLLLRESIIKQIKELDKGNGADIEDVIEIDNSAEEMLNELLNEGTGFEPKMGKVKLL